MISNNKKKGHRADGGIFFSDFMLISKKKKDPSSEFCKFSTHFVRHTKGRRCEPQLSTVFGGKQTRRSLAGEKTPEFAKFQSENARKNFALFALFCAYREHWWWPRQNTKDLQKKNEDILYWLDETPTPAHSKTNKTELFSNLFHHTYLILLKRRGHSFLLQSGLRKEMVARSRTNNYHCYMFLHHMASMETKHLYQQIRITVKLSQCQLIFQFALISWIFKN